MWRPITGTGCAHGVAHQKKITAGTPSTRCTAGFTIRVRDLYNHVTSRLVASRNDVKVGDIWMAIQGTDWTSHDHCGIVTKVLPTVDPKTKTKVVKITIKHDSSGQGRVAEDDFDTRFNGKGRFFRLP